MRRLGTDIIRHLLIYDDLLKFLLSKVLININLILQIFMSIGEVLFILQIIAHSLPPPQGLLMLI